MGIQITNIKSVYQEKLSGDRTGESYASIQARVQAACNTQFKRFSNISQKDIVCNADMRTGKMMQFCKLPE